MAKAPAIDSQPELSFYNSISCDRILHSSPIYLIDRKTAIFRKRQLMTELERPKNPLHIQNWIGASTAVVTPSASQPANRLEVRSPYDHESLGSVPISDRQQVNLVVEAAKKGFETWRSVSLKERCQILLNFRAKLLEQSDRLSHLIAWESGKTHGEAKAGLMKGVEVLEFASAMQNMDLGHISEVSRGIFCQNTREALGVVAGITPFNFPAMVPMWMMPIAIGAGNAFILKPSEKVPLTAWQLAKFASESGLPDGVFSTLNGDAQTVEHLIQHPDVKAIAFVGSTAVAKSVYARSAAEGKRALCLGGAKNTLIVAPDCDPEMTINGVVSSFTGCAGQRCMAASLMLVIEGGESLIAKICATAKAIKLGTDMGAIISREALDRHHRAIERALTEGATLLVDGRQARPGEKFKNGFWLGPTIIDHATMQMECANQELFGPILTIVRVKNLSEALNIEASLPYGNATSIFTSSGQTARMVSDKASSGMVGINIGVPVPREPFSFGGSKDSKFGCGDITGMEAIHFWSKSKKITSKWQAPKDQNWMS